MFKKIVLLFLFCGLAYADTAPQSWFSIDDKKNVTLQLSLFMASNCQHCHKADEFFTEFVKNNPWLEIKRYVINSDKEAVKTYLEYLQYFKTDDIAVPTIVFCDSRWVGFSTEDKSAQTLTEAFKFCREQIALQNGLSVATVNSLRASSAKYEK